MRVAAFCRDELSSTRNRLVTAKTPAKVRDCGTPSPARRMRALPRNTLRPNWTPPREWLTDAATMIGPAKIYFIIFGVLTIIGGVMGYAKAGSVPSIVAGAGRDQE